MSRRTKHIQLSLQELVLSDGEDDSSSASTWAGSAEAGPPRGRRGSHRRAGGHHAPPLTSADYINMTCRFVVHPDTPAIVATRPDRHLPSEAVLRVLAPVAECPICLEPATIPRMIRCGHIMCLVCLQRFFRHAEEHLCPLCTRHVPKATTPVSFLDSDERFLPQAGHEVVLKLMRKPRQGLPIPVSEAEELERNGTTVDTARFPPPSASLYARIMAGDASYIKKEGHEELRLLQKARRAEDELTGDTDGYDAATAEIRATIDAGLPQLPPDTFKSLVPVDDPLSRKRDKDAPASGGSQAPFYFYQTGFDSPTIFILQQLDISVLKSAFGDYDSFPASLVVRVDNILHATMDEHARRRYKYLAHVPLHSTLALLECDWRGVIPEDTIKTFGAQLRDRRRKKRDKDRRDEKRRVEAQKVSDAMMRADVLEAAPIPRSPPVNMNNLPVLGDKPRVAPKAPKWDTGRADREEFDELLRNAHVTKKGRKRIVLL